MSKKEALSLLGLSGDPSEQEIKKAYRKLATEHHPDKNSGNKESEEKFKKVTAAYETLTKPQQQQRGQPQDFNDQFERFFHGGSFKFSTGQKAQSKRPPVKRPSERVIKLEGAELSVQVDIESLLLRTPIELKLQIECCCKDCLGNPEDWFPCDSCKQVGYVSFHTNTPIGSFTQEQVCNVCHGNGWVNKRSCKTCRDRLVHFKDKVITFSIPSDFKHGQKIKLDGAGREGWNCPAGDLIINPRFTIPDYSTLSEDDRKALAEMLGKK